jgi:hypothetical protein
VNWWSVVDVVEVAVGVVAGGFINWYFSRRASAELSREAERLRRETAKLRHHMRLLMRGLQNEGTVELTWEQGEPGSLMVRLSGTAGSAAGMSGTLTVGDNANEGADDEEH